MTRAYGSRVAPRSGRCSRVRWEKTLPGESQRTLLAWAVPSARFGRKEQHVRDYQAPTVTDLGSLHDMTLSDIYKTAGSGDFIHVAGIPAPIPAPGGGVVAVS